MLLLAVEKGAVCGTGVGQRRMRTTTNFHAFRRFPVRVQYCMLQEVLFVMVSAGKDRKRK